MVFDKNNVKHIWDKLYATIKNSYGVAGLMGNLMAESTFNSTSIGKGKSTSPTAGYTVSDSYILAVDSGLISRDDFIHDGRAFGIVQWCYYTRKAALYDYARKVNKSIGDLDMQLDFMLSELQNYKTVWVTLQTAKTVREASDIVMLKYEKPANTGDTAKNNREKFGLDYYNAFYQNSNTKQKSGKYVESSIDSLLVRSGNGSEYGSCGKIPKAGTRYPWIATSENNWHAIIYNKKVLWVSGAFSKVIVIE